MDQEFELRQAIVLKDPAEVQHRLSQLGISADALLRAVAMGQLAFSSCTGNHPPMARGGWAWAETVRGLREELIRLGWTKSEINNYSLVVSPDRKIAIAVATGDEATGSEWENPTTRSKKGPNTVRAIDDNVEQMQFPFPKPVIQGANDMDQVAPIEAAHTYILLIHRTRERVRAELSLPTAIENGRVNGWSERMLLGDIDLDGAPLDLTDFDLPDIDVEIVRRA